MMKRAIFLVLLTGCLAAGAQTKYQYWVGFADKNNSPYSIDNPSAYLSQRALDRRQKYGIAIDSLDLPVNPSYLEAVAATGVQMLNPSKWANGVTVMANSDMEAQLRALPCVSEVELLNRVTRYGTTQRISSGTLSTRKTWQDTFSANWYAYGYTQINMMNGIALHQAGYMGQGVLIGVVDAGFMGIDTVRAFRHVYDEGRMVATRNFVLPDDPNVYDYCDHGSEVFASMAAYEPGFAVGTAPLASYALCITEENGNESKIEEYNWISAIEFLDSLGADIINASLGYFDFDLGGYGLDDLDGQTAISSRMAAVGTSKGMLIVMGCGNDGMGYPHLSVPSDAECVLSVGSVNSTRQYSAFSSRGPTADGRIKPDIAAMGENISVIAPDGKMTWSNGTSLAGPVACGMMACVMQLHPDCTPAMLSNAARRWGAYSEHPDNRCGYGIPDFSKALEQNPQTLGLGVVDAPGLSAYPNPTDGTLHVACKGVEQVEVYDIRGNRLLHSTADRNATETTVDMSRLPAGMYIVRTITDGTTTTTKVIKK